MGRRAAPDVIVCHDADEWQERAVREFRAVAERSVAERRRFRLALAGGSTPKAVYAALAREPFRQQLPWSRTEVFWGDERCVPPDHPDSNYHMARETLLAHVSVPNGQIHRVRTELSEPDEVAADYEGQLYTAFGVVAGHWPQFDLVLLGMGRDGHTASLFPHSPTLREQSRLAVAVYAAGSSTPQRITLTLPVLNAARRVMFLVRGADKAEPLRDVLQGAWRPEHRPAQAVQPQQGRTVWIVDRAAARLLRLERLTAPLNRI